MGSEALLIAVIVTALVFDFTNGFHDTANAMATSIATKALPPRTAVAISAILNFAGAFISIAVATTIAEGIVDNATIGLTVIFAALLGAIAWNLVTWLAGLPSSSSQALIGGLVGAAFASGGSGAVDIDGVVSTVLIPAVLAPLLAGGAALAATVIAYRLRQRMSEGISTRGFRLGQIGTASLVSLAHGTNDAQKTMGVIVLALVVHGNIDPDNLTIPLWVKLAAASSIAIGTYVGGWRIIQTLGQKLTSIEPPQGFSIEASGASVLLASSYYGFPLSTTQVVSGAVVGSGIGKKLASVHWGVFGRMAGAWALTIPAAGLVAYAAWRLSDLLGESTGGPIALAVLGIAGCAGMFFLASKNPVTASDV